MQKQQEQRSINGAESQDKRVESQHIEYIIYVKVFRKSWHILKHSKAKS